MIHHNFPHHWWPSLYMEQIMSWGIEFLNLIPRVFHLKTHNVANSGQKRKQHCRSACALFQEFNGAIQGMNVPNSWVTEEGHVYASTLTNMTHFRRSTTPIKLIGAPIFLHKKVIDGSDAQSSLSNGSNKVAFIH